jgi:hypothetical protein
VPITEWVGVLALLVGASWFVRLKAKYKIQLRTSGLHIAPLLFASLVFPRLPWSGVMNSLRDYKEKAGLKLGFRLQTGQRKSRRLGLIIENQPATPAIVLLHRRLEASPEIVGLDPEGDAGTKLVIHAAARHEPQAGIGANS